MRKVVPKKAELVEAFRLFKDGERIRKLVEAEIAKPNGVAVPADLEKRVRAYLKQHPARAVGRRRPPPRDGLMRLRSCKKRSALGFSS